MSVASASSAAQVSPRPAAATPKRVARMSAMGSAYANSDAASPADASPITVTVSPTSKCLEVSTMVR